MKQGTTFSMVVSFDGIEIENVEKIEFLFKMFNSKSAHAEKRATYPGDVSLTADGDAFIVPWTAEETYRFTANNKFYMDTRIALHGVDGNPETPIIPLIMNPTLFGEGE